MDAELSLDSPFSYVCHRCTRCCHGKQIRLLPYDIARLAEARGTSTGEFIREFTDDGVFLKWVEGGDACKLLGESGCTVHTGRPAACRTYPLGHRAYRDGSEGYVRLEPHPQTAGVYGESGTVREFIDAQGVRPFLAWAQRYHELLTEMAAALASAPPDAEIPESEDEDAHLYDVDAIVERYCAENGLDVPDTVDGRIELHLAALRSQLNSLPFSQP